MESQFYLISFGLLALLGARLLYRTGGLALTGLEYLVLGVVFGYQGLNVISAELVRSLNPVVAFSLGWIGLLCGLQFERRRLRSTPPLVFSWGLIEGLAAFAIAGAGTAGAIFIIDAWREGGGHAGLGRLALLGLALGSLAAITSPAILNVLAARMQRPPRMLGLIGLVSGFDSALGILGCGLLFSVFHFWRLVESRALDAAVWLGLSLAMGLALGFMLHLILIGRRSMIDTVVLAVGFITFSAGLAGYLRLSPLFVNMVAGAVAVNFRGFNSSHLGKILVRMERPVYAVLLLLLGAVWAPGSPWYLLAGCLFVLLRFAGKWIGTLLVGVFQRRERWIPRWSALALLPHGGLAIAMGLSYRQFYMEGLGPSVVTILIVAVVLTEFLSVLLLPGVLRRWQALQSSTSSKTMRRR